MHDLVVEKAKFSHPLTCERGLHCQDHARMNACILSDVHAIQWQNDQKAIPQAHAKAHVEWDHLQSLAKGKFKIWKPPLVRLISNQLL